MHFNDDQSQRQALQQAFSLQYITVIIIILAFLVGTFSSRSFKNKKTQTAAVVEELILSSPSSVENMLQSELQLSELLSSESLQVSSSNALPVAMLLANHDLIAEIKVNLGLCKNEENKECFENEFQAIKNLSDFFISQNLPADSFRIYYAPEMNQSKTQISFIAGQNGI